MPQSIWNIIYADSQRTVRGSDDAMTAEVRIQRTQDELHDAAAEKRANAQYWRNCMIIGYNDTVRSAHAFLVRHLFGEELG